jgi:uncharacterized protein (TIRG00374 family)
VTGSAAPADGVRTPPSRLSWFLRLLLGVVVFWIAFRDVDVPALGRAFALVDLRWIAAGVASVLCTVVLVAVRWRILLGVAPGRRPRRVLLSAIIASQAANIVMPFKLGDAVRIGAVSRALGLPAAQVLGSVAMERLFDALMAGVTALLLVALGQLPEYARAGLMSFGIAVALGLGALALIARSPQRLERRLAPLTRSMPARIQRIASRQAGLMLIGLQRASAPGTFGAALAVSAGIAAGSVLSALLVLRGFALDVPAVAAAVVVVVGQIGSAVVPVPGAVGVAQVITVETLQLWKIGEAPALAFALMLYLVSRVPKVVLLPFALRVLFAKPREVV